jgi:hypothetical protein
LYLNPKLRIAPILTYVRPYAKVKKKKVKRTSIIGHEGPEREAVRGSNPGGGERFSAPVQTCPLSLLCNGNRVSYPGIKRPRRGLTTHPCIAPRLKKTIPITLFPLWAFMACYRLNVTFTF